MLSESELARLKSFKRAELLPELPPAPAKLATPEPDPTDDSWAEAFKTFYEKTTR